MSKKCLLVQPAAFGDIIVCAPIAEYYNDLGYEVIWPTGSKTAELVKRLPYVTHIMLDDNDVRHPEGLRSDAMKIHDMPLFSEADLVLNLCDRGPGPTMQWVGYENFEQCKYRLAKVPFEKKYKLRWRRNFAKEDELIALVAPHKEYVFAHLTSSHNDKAEMPEEILPVVEAREIDGFCIFDWFGVMANATRLYMVESAFACFADGIMPALQSKPFLLRRSAAAPGERHLVGKNFDHTLIGETRLTG